MNNMGNSSAADTKESTAVALVAAAGAAKVFHTNAELRNAIETVIGDRNDNEQVGGRRRRRRQTKKSKKSQRKSKKSQRKSKKSQRKNQ